MLQGVLNLFKSYFGFVFDFYDKTFMLSDGISAWDFLLICFVAGGIITLIIRAFGANGIAQGGSSAVNVIKRSNSQKSNKGG